MVSTQTQEKLVRLLRTLAKGEQEIEDARQRLARNPNFESYTAFKRIDHIRDSVLTTCEVADFLSENGVQVLDSEIKNLFKTYSSSAGVRLNYNDFQKIVLPKQDSLLRHRCLSRKVQYIDSEEYLSPDVEKALANFLLAEINLLEKVETLKEDLSIKYDFGLIEAFGLIDVEKRGSLHFGAIYDFMNSTMTATRDDIIAILARFDKDKDQELNYCEFNEILQPANPNYRVALRSNSPRIPYRETRLSSPLRSPVRSPVNKKNLADEDYNDYLRDTARTFQSSRSLYDSAYKYSSPQRSPQRSYFDASPSPVRVSRALFNDYSPVKATETTKSLYISSTLDKIQQDNLRVSVAPISEKRETEKRVVEEVEGFEGLDTKEKKELARFLKQEIDLEKNLETIKKELALQRKYNSGCIFRLFDVEGKGYITRGQLEGGLKELNIFPSKNELFLLMRSLDKDDDGLIRFSDFRETISPKGENDKSVFDKEQEQEVGHEVKRIVRKLFNKIISNETAAEEYRREIGKQTYFTVYEAFVNLKRYAKNWITATTIKDLLSNQGVYATLEDAELLVARINRKNNNRVSYSEFVDEITQKLP